MRALKYWLPLAAFILTGAALLHPIDRATAQQPMGPGMMGPGMMGQGMMGQGMLGQGCPGMMGPGMGQGMMGQGMMGPGMMDQGMMGQGMMGPGMMGHGGMGQGMMGSGMMGQGMMGQGMMGQGMMDHGKAGQGFVMLPAPPLLSAADVTYNLERLLAARGNPRLKVGSVADKDAGTITGEIVTTDGSLVERYEVDKRSGLAKLVP